MIPNWTYDNTWANMTRRAATAPIPRSLDPIETAADDVLIFELIKRGYAVAQMPADELAKEVQ